MSEGTKKPAFVGQALLLLAPVVVLLAIGLNSLRQDKIQAHREAAERAQQLAESLASRGVSMLTAPKDEQPTASYVFRVNASAELMFPPMMNALIPEPLLISELSAEQADLWRKARESEMQSNRTDQAIGAYLKLLKSEPPARFAANALYSLGLLYDSRGEHAAATGAFRRLLETHGKPLAESGMSLRPLAMLKVLELQSRVPESEPGASLDSVCSNLVFDPTPLTRALLRQADQLARKSGQDSTSERWMELWREQERTRQLYAGAQHSLANGPTNLSARAAFWFTAPGGHSDTNQALAQASQNWLAVPFKNSSTDCWYTCYPADQLQNFAPTLMIQAGPVPDYFGAEIKLGGNIIASSERQDGSPANRTERTHELLGSAIRPDSANGWMEVKAFLTQPAISYRHQRVRQFWFGALIVACAAAALAGLFSNWRAFKRQRRLNELRSNFVSSVSHELRTPVASVRLLVEGLESGRISGAAKQKEYLQLMGQECRRLSSLIDNVLDFSRIDDGRKQFEFSRTDVEALVSETVKMLEPYAAARKISLVLNAARARPANLDTPILDGLAIRQALLNLLDNAIKHSPEGNVVILGVDWVGSNNGQDSRVSISVEDNGPGIPAEEHEKIFERFYRRGSELNRETQGIGIGLTIVKHIVDAHGGRVLVRSAVGQGSKFTMELPLSRKEKFSA